jgi:hypothetical protein
MQLMASSLFSENMLKDLTAVEEKRLAIGSADYVSWLINLAFRMGWSKSHL